uniref:Uncharacterized protein n=1 Tax=Panagrolaimus sp. ES5 TaxID=591445 RepID=A0AC34FT99_9BILA
MDVERIMPTLTSSKYYLSPFISKPGASPKKGYKEMQKHIIDNLKPTSNVITLTKDYNKTFLNKAIVYKSLKLLEKKPFKFDVPNIGFYDFGIATGDIMKFMMMFRPRKDYMKIFLTKISKTENHPITKTFVNYEKFNELFFCEGPPNVPGFTCIPKGYAPELGLAISLSVDKYLKGGMAINELTQKGYESFVGNAMFISLNDSSFKVEIVKAGKLCDTGLNNIPMPIAFADNKIQIGNEAIKIKPKQNSFVITDIFKIISTDPKMLKINPKWGFQLIKDENGKTLLEFDTFRGRRKSTPEFLFAFFIRWAVKSVELKYGKMPEKVVIVKKELNDEMKKIFEHSFLKANLKLSNVQISEYKIIEINNLF